MVKPTIVRTATPADPDDHVQVFVSARLRSSAAGETTAQTRLAQSTAPDVEPPAPAAAAQPGPRWVPAVRSAKAVRGRRGGR
ncbi:hypothetical protein [Streptomyces adustus]